MSISLSALLSDSIADDVVDGDPTLQFVLGTRADAPRCGGDGLVDSDGSTHRPTRDETPCQRTAGRRLIKQARWQG